MGDKIMVTVDTSGTPSCVPNPLDVGKSNGNVVIKWRLENDATSKLYEVTNVTIADDSTGEFSNPGKDSGDGWKITNKNDNTNLYSYEITVGLKTTGEQTSHDPGIRNGGRN